MIELRPSARAAGTQQHHTFTLVFRYGVLAILDVYGATNQDEARAVACNVLPENGCEIKDGDQSEGRAVYFYGWTCAIHHTCTCVFPGGQIAVVHVTGAKSAEEARAAVRAVWYPCRYEVQGGDPTNGYAEPFYLRLDDQRARAG